MLNPRANRESQLGVLAVDFVARRTELLAYLDSQNSKVSVDEALARAALTVAVTDRVWEELKKSVGTA